MRTRKNWLRTTIAMITLIATVIETGFSSVATYAAVLDTDDSAIVSDEAQDSVISEDGAVLEDASTDSEDVGEAPAETEINISAPSEEDIAAPEEADKADEAAPAEEADEQNEAGLDVSDNGISGSGYDEIAIYIDTKNLATNDSFRVKFVGADSAAYNPVLNDDLDKTNGGKYIFEELNKEGFSIRATSTDNVILSYNYNENGDPVITAASKSVDKTLATKILTAVDDTKISAIEGEGYESITIDLDTEDLTAKDVFKFYVESSAPATVDGKSAIVGIEGLTKSAGPITVENLGGKSFVAYVVSDSDDTTLETVAEVTSIEKGTATIDVNGVATKRVYEYEDDKVYVRATLSKADAIPDDAYFAVTPLGEEDAAKYLEFLNSNKEEEEEEYNEFNTLLYDIAFYTDESKSEEIEPEDGLVTVSVEFKQNQVSEDLGIEDKENIEVTHIIENGSAMEAETLAVKQTGDVDTVEVVTDSFSVFVIKGISNGQVNVGEPGYESPEAMLGSAWLYGITANTWEFDGESETSFAAKSLVNKGNGGQTGANKSRTPDSRYQYSMVGEVSGTTPIKIKGFSCELTAPKSEQGKFFNSTDDGGSLTFVTMDKEGVDSRIDGMISYVTGESDRLAALNSIKNYNGLPQGDSAGKLEINITGAEDGAYYIDVDKYPALLHAFTVSSGVKIIKNPGQKLVFNFNGTGDYQLDKFSIEQNGVPFDSTGIANITKQGEPCVAEDIIFNFPKAANILAHDVAGIFLAPRSTFKFTGVDGGWLVANKAISNAEWHFLNSRVTEPKPSSLRVEIPVNKRFIGGQGQWREGFTFTLERLDASGKNVQNDSQTPQTITFKAGDSDTATQSFFLDFDDTKPGNIHWDRNDDGTYWGYEYVHQEWYRISELKDRSDVNYDILLSEFGFYRGNNGKYYDKDGNVVDEDYWYVHLFIYKDDQEYWRSGQYKNKAEYRTVIRTARINPATFNWSNPLPCENDRPIWFVNEFVKPVTVVLEGEKFVNGDDKYVPTGKFTFTLQNYTRNNQWQAPTAKYTVTNDGSHFTFPEIELDLNGPTGKEVDSRGNGKYYYYYKISETNNCAPYDPDPAVYIAKVTVTKDGTNLSTKVDYFRFPNANSVNCSYAQQNKQCNGVKITSLYFNNTYEANGEAQIFGIKWLEGRFLDDEDVFTFELSSDDDDQEKASQTKSFKVKDIKAAGQNSFDFAFDKLTYDINDAGKTYHYKVKETVADDDRDPSIVYDSHEYEVTVTLTDDKNNHLIVDQNDGLSDKPLEFINVYSAKGDVTFKAEKVYPKDTLLARNKVFTFHLEGGKSDGTAQISQEKKITGPGTVLFETINFADTAAVGTYNYAIWEDIPEGAVVYDNDPTKKIFEGIIYDARVYNVTVEVTDNKSGVLQVKTYGAYDNAEKVDITAKGVDPDFVNDYRLDVIDIKLRGEKSLPGLLPERGAFKFDLAAYGDTVADVGSAVIMPAETSAYNGVPDDRLSVNEFEFDKITFTKVGTYQFSITEDKAYNPIDNIVYSQDEFIVTVKVTDDGKGKLAIDAKSGVTTTLNGTTDVVDVARFVNTPYNPGEVPVIAKKILIGRKLQANQFTFELVYGDNVIQTAQNDITGLAKFKNLKYSLKDLEGADTKTFQYIIREVIPEGAKYDENLKVYKKDGYTYDTHKEIVNVTIKKGKDASGNPAIEVESDNAYTGKYATFTNEYVAKGQFDFGGNKIIRGRKFNEATDKGMWWADLYEGNKVIQSAEITKDTSIWGNYSAEFHFDPIYYVNDKNEPEETKVYYYKVKERGLVKNVTNSKMVYEVKVTVTDNGKGELIVSPEYLKGQPTFVNFYEAKNSVNFEAFKRVKDEKVELKDRMFDFTLTDVTDPENPKVIDTAQNYGAQISFKTIEFDQDDVEKSPFVYKINEVTKNKKGWKLSEEEFTAKAFLTYNETTQEIDVRKEYYKTVNGKEVKIDAAEVVFENEYNAEGFVEIPVRKNLVDRELKEGQFTFELYSEADLNNPIDTVVNPAAKVGEFAEATFKPIKYTMDSLKESTTYKIGENLYKKIYFVKEFIPEGAVEQLDGTWKFEGYTYDSSVYYVEVLLEDKEDGTIETNWMAYQSGSLPRTPGFWDKIIKFVTGNANQPDEFIPANKNIIFTNTYEAEGAIDLSAKKIFTGKELKAGAFKFILEGKDERGQKFQYSGVNDVNGMVSFNRINYTKPGSYEYTLWEDLPEGVNADNNYTLDGVKYDATIYTITVVVKDTDKGTLDVKAYLGTDTGVPPVASSAEVTVNGKTIGLCAPEAFVFTNTYVPTEVSIYPGGHKTLDGRPIKDEEFEFTLQGKDGNPKGTTPETVKNYGNAFTFTPITFKPEDMLENGIYVSEKTFEYTLTEVRGSLSGVTYDERTYDIVVTVKNEKGALTAAITSNGISVDPDDLATFYNPYDAEGTVSFRVHKTVEGLDTDKVFKFILTDDETGKEYVEYCKANETKKIAEFKYELDKLPKVNGIATKTFNYTCNEYVPTDEDETAGWTFSQNVYKAVVVVTDNEDGTLDVDKKIYLNGDIYSDSDKNDDDTMEFVNKYHAEGEVEVPGIKYLEGRDLTKGEFTFALGVERNLDVYGNRTFETIAETTNDADGTFKFIISGFNQDDIGRSFNYRVSEVLPGVKDPAMIYSDAIYDVTVTVKNGGKGKLDVKRTITKDGQLLDPTEPCTFINKVVKPNTVSFPAKKTLEGLPLQNYMFTFSIAGDGQDGNKYYQEVTNNGEDVVFDDIQYGLQDAGKTYHYIIKEVIQNRINGMTYAEIPYDAEVKVYLDNNNEIQVDKEIRYNGTVLQGDKLEFKNKFEASIKIPLGGSKILDGFPKDAPSIGQYKYYFDLYDEAGTTVIDSAEVLPKDSDTPVAYSFKPLEFDQDDMLDPANPEHEFRYLVKERVPVYEQDKAPNVTYDETEYHVTVKLFYDTGYELKAYVTTDQGVTPDKLDFTNKYLAEGEEIIDGIKTIEGKTLEDKAYTFELTHPDGTVEKVTNKGAKFSFKKLSFVADDIGKTYTYKVTESMTTGDNSNPDTTEYYVDLKIDEGNNGKVEVSRDDYIYDEKDQKQPLPAGKIEFHNTYKATGEIPIEGIKVMHNKPLAQGDFWFILRDENGVELQRVTHGAANLNNKEELEARAAFAFAPLKFDQEVLKASDGSYMKEVQKYYTVDEAIAYKGGVKYSKAAYAIEVTIKDNGNGTLSVTKNVVGKNIVNKDNNGLPDFLKSLLGKFADKKDEIIFENEYDSECTIDPPILRKQMVGKEIERGDFTFKVSGPGLRSMNEKEYVRYVKNGINSVDGSYLFPNGEPMPEGEIYVGDIKYKYIDLVDDPSFTLEAGAKERTFEYEAVELDTGAPGITYSNQKFRLVVTAIENDDGTISVKNGRGELVNDNPDDKAHKLYWEPVNPYVFSDEQMEDVFLNTYNGETSIDLPGIKKLDGRKLTDNDKFEFTITDDATGAQAKAVNDGSKISFDAKDISFLNYKFGVYEKNPDRKADDPVELEQIDNTGEHVYTISENNISKPDIKCDTSTFKVHVDVKVVRDEKGNPVIEKGKIKMEAKVTKVEKLYSDNNKVAFDFANNNYYEFVNEFKATGNLSFSGKKYVKKNKPEGLAEKEISLEGKYEFALYQYDDASRTTGKKLIDTQKTDKDGNYKLTVPAYDQDVLKNASGEYEDLARLYYRIIEVKPANGSWTEGNTVFESDGIIYDNTEYDVNVTVENDGTSNLKVEKKIVKAVTGEEVQNIDFFNSEVAVAEYTTVSGNKVWIDGIKDPAKRPKITINLYSSAVNGGKTVINSVDLTNGQTHYEFTEDSSKNPLPVYDANGKEIKYDVEEVPVEGYVSEKKGYDFYNTKGDVVIQKIDADTDEPLAGATLAIYDGKTQVEKWTSGNSAHVIEATLTPGKSYTLREIAAPDGYELAADISFTVPANGSSITVTMSDKPVIGSVRLHKLDSSTRKALSGAEFALYTSTGTRIYATGTAGKYKATSKTSNGVFIVNSAGTLDITELPKGTYYFVETKAPEGYELSSEKLSFTISDSKALVEVTYLNKQSVAAVKLRKVGSTGTRGLEGAVFELYAKTPRTSSQAVSSTIYPDGYYRYGTYTTNSSGEIRVENLPWDDYYFVETKAPEGYTIATDVGGETLAYTFTVDSSTSGSTIDLGDIVNNPEEIDTGVLGERVEPEKPSGVLGVRSAPKKGVLGTRVGPATGDASAIALWLTLLVACIGTIIWMLASKKKKALGK